MYGNQRQGNFAGNGGYAQPPVNYQQPNGGYMMQQQAMPPGMNGMNMGMQQNRYAGNNMRPGQPSYQQMDPSGIRPGMGGNGGYGRGPMDGQHQMQQMGGAMNNMHGQPNGYMNPGMGQNNYQNTRGYYNDGGQRNNMMGGSGNQRNPMQGNIMGKGNLGGGRMGNGGINGFNNGGMDGGFNNSDFPAIGGGMMNQNGGMGVDSYQNALQHMPAPQPPKPEFNMDDEDFPTLGGPAKKKGGGVGGGDTSSSKDGDSGVPQQQQNNSDNMNETKQDVQRMRHRRQDQPNQQQYQQQGMPSVSHQQRQPNNQ